jgi:hypothetical protein
VAALICAPALPALTRRITIYGWSTRGPMTCGSSEPLATVGDRCCPCSTGGTRPIADRVHEACVASRPNPLAAGSCRWRRPTRIEQRERGRAGMPLLTQYPRTTYVTGIPWPYVVLGIVAVIVVYLAILKTHFVSASCVPTPERRPVGPAGSVLPPRRADRPARSSGPPSGPSPSGT